MVRYEVKFTHPDATTETIPNLRTEKIEQYGKKTIFNIIVNRDDVNNVDYVEEESEVELIDATTGDVVDDVAGIVRDVVPQEGEAVISTDSYEQFAMDEEPIRDLVFSQLDDATIARFLVDGVPQLDAGQLESVSQNITQEFADVTYSKAIDEIAGLGGGHPIYRADKTVDYVQRRGRDRPNTILAPRYDNVEFSKPDKEDQQRITHVRMIGDGVKVNVIADNYTQGEKQTWTINDDYSDVPSQDKLESLGEQYISQFDETFTRVEAEIRGLTVELGDLLTIDYPDQDLNEELYVTKLTTIYDRGISYEATLASTIVLGRPLEYDSDPSGWVSYRSSQRSRGYTSDAVNPEDRWTGQIVSTTNTSVGQTDPEVAISGDTVAVSSTFTSSDGSDTARLNVYDAQSGEERYEKNIDAGSEGVGCLIAGPYVVAASAGGHVEAYDKYTGDNYASNESTGYTFEGQPQHDDGTVYLPTNAGDVVGFDLFDNLAENWSTNAAVTGSARTPAIGDGRVYTVSNSGGSVAAYSLDDGTQQWTTSASGDANFSPAYFDGVVAYQNLLSSSNDEIYALDASDGTEKWSATVEYGGLSAYDDLNGPVPALGRAPELVSESATEDGDGNTMVAYAVNDSGELVVLDINDGGNELTTIALDTGIIPQVAVGANRAYVASEDQSGVYVVSLSTGSTSQLDSPHSDFVVSPSVGSNVVAAVAHNSTDEQEEAVVWYQSPEGAPSESQAGSDDDESYDETPGDTSAGEYIDRVEMGKIDNQSGDNDGYADFTSQSTPLLTEATSAGGDSEEITVHAATGGNDNHVAVYVDWNRTYDMSEAQRYDLGTVNDGGGEPATMSTTISVPGDADVADVRMRVVQSRQSYQDPPTSDGWYGEMEDYTISVVEDGGFWAPEERLSVSITSVDSPVSYGENATVEAEITNNAPFEEAALPTLEIDGVGVDVGGWTSIPGGGSTTVTLQWDVSDGFPAPPEDGSRDWQACVVAEADGIPFAEWSDCATVKVTGALTISASLSDSSEGDVATTQVASSDEVANASTVSFDWSFDAIDEPYGSENLGVISLEIDGNSIWSESFAGGESGGGTEQIDISSYDSAMELLVDDGDGAVSPP